VKVRLFLVLVFFSLFSQKIQATQEVGVEVKVSIPPYQIHKALKTLHLTLDEGGERSIYFYDTPQLMLYKSGVILRTRKINGEEDDSTVKIRPLDPTRVDPEWFEVDGFKCEIDDTGKKQVTSCSLKTYQKSYEIDEVVEGTRKIKRLFSEAQEEFLRQYQETEVNWDELIVLGPIASHVWELEMDSNRGKIDVELWTLPRGLQFLEFSVKTQPENAVLVRTDIIQFLKSKKLKISTKPIVKTAFALRYFASHNR